MSKVFIGCSSYDTINDIYKEEAKKVAEICLEKDYDLVFGSCTKGSMGKLYETYINSNKKITAICLRKFIEDIKPLDKEKVDIIITDTTIEQIDEFMKCDKIIYLAGGYGTLTELIYLINAKANKIHNKDIIIINTNNFYDKILEHFDKLYKEGFTKDNSLYYVINDYKELIDIL